MYCRKCGAKLIEDSLFCAKCGTRVEETPVPTAAEEEQPAETSQPKADTSEDKAQKEEPKESGESALLFSPEEAATGRMSSTSAPPQSAVKPSSPSPEPTEEKPAAGDSPPSGSALPESLLPKPDGVAKSVEQERVGREKRIKAKKLKKERKRWHPLDAYKPIKNRLQLGGCGLLILLLVVIPVLVAGVLGWIQYDTFVKQKGYASVQQVERNVVGAPEDDTFFWTWKLWQGVLYEAPETTSEIAIVGGTWWLGGTFREKVYFRGYQLILEDGARFENGLDVSAVQFDPGNAEIEGELTGSIAIQK